MYQVISKYDGKVKFAGILFSCQKWIQEHGSDWHMHLVVKT